MIFFNPEIVTKYKKNLILGFSERVIYKTRCSY